MIGVTSTSLASYTVNVFSDSQGIRQVAYYSPSQIVLYAGPRVGSDVYSLPSEFYTATFVRISGPYINPGSIVTNITPTYTSNYSNGGHGSICQAYYLNVSPDFDGSYILATNQRFDYTLTAYKYTFTLLGATGPTGPTNTAICATARSTASQTLSANVSENLQHDVADFAYGISVTTGANGYFQVPSTGIYKIIPSLQVTATGNGDIHVWIKVNGTNVNNTTTYMTFKNGDKHIFTTELLLQLNANDQVQLWVQSSISGGVIEYIAAGGTSPNNYPAAPGIITNMYKLR
jgi:hypothetical protein